MFKFSHALFALAICGLQAADVAFVLYQEKPEDKSNLVSTVQANRLGLRQIEGKGIGYPCGYTTLETFLTPFSNFEEYLPFVDLRAHRLDDGHFDGNAGLGIRYFSDTDCYIWGANTYFDYRQTKRSTYRQMALGLEALGRNWDFRFNAYLPYDKPKSPRYHGNTREIAMRGLDAEAAYHWIQQKKTDMLVALGPYHFHGTPDKNAIGGKFRLKAKFLNSITVEGIVSYDNIFKWNVQGQLAFYIPLGPKLKDKGIIRSDCNCYETLEQRLVQPVERSEIIVTTHRH